MGCDLNVCLFKFKDRSGIGKFVVVGFRFIVSIIERLDMDGF